MLPPIQTPPSCSRGPRYSHELLNQQGAALKDTVMMQDAWVGDCRPERQTPQRDNPSCQDQPTIQPGWTLLQSSPAISKSFPWLDINLSSPMSITPQFRAGLYANVATGSHKQYNIADYKESPLFQRSKTDIQRTPRLPGILLRPEKPTAGDAGDGENASSWYDQTLDDTV